MLWQAKKADGELSSGSKPSKVVEFRRKPEPEQVTDGFSAISHPSTDAPVGLRERQWQRMVIGLSGLSMAALALSGFTLYQLHQPQQQRVEQLAVHQNPTQLLHKSTVYSVAFSPDGKHIVSGSGDKTVQIWDATTGQPIGAPLIGHSDLVYSVAFSPDGKRIVSGGLDKTVQIWDATTGQSLGKPLTGHSEMVYSVAFSPDGKRIVSGSGDKTVRLWDVPTKDSNQLTPDNNHKSSPSSPALPVTSKGSEAPRSMASHAITPRLKTADDESSFSSRQKPRQRPRHQLRPNRILAKSLPAKRLRSENNAKPLVYRPSGKLFVSKQAAP